MKQKILIADDEPCVRRILTRVLSSGPYDLVVASDGKQALDIATAENPDIILLDIDMPLKSGLDVLRELRQNDHTRLIPVIMLTGDSGYEAGGLDIGASDYITKPFSTDDLKARISGALRLSRLAVSACSQGKRTCEEVRTARPQTSGYDTKA